MTEVKTFKIEEKFRSVEELYGYLLKNVKLLEQVTEIKIQKPLKFKNFCIIAKEKITERNILIYASKSEFHEGLGELIISAGTFDADIIIFLIPKIIKAHLEPLNWLNKICAEDYQIIVGQVKF